MMTMIPSSAQAEKLPLLQKHRLLLLLLLLLELPSLHHLAQRCAMFDHSCFLRHAFILQTLFGDDDDDSFFDKKPAASKPVAKAPAGAFHVAITCLLLLAKFLCFSSFSSSQRQELV
jgi:hypothetical protein